MSPQKKRTRKSLLFVGRELVLQCPECGSHNVSASGDRPAWQCLSCKVWGRM